MGEAKTELRDGKSVHFSVGAIIEKDGQVLLIDRANPPFGLAGPAGHVDVGEQPETALYREVQEETGLVVESAHLLLEKFIPWNKCAQGVTGHHWYVYRAETSGYLKPAEWEAKSINWYTLKANLKFEPVWHYWFENLKMI